MIRNFPRPHRPAILRASRRELSDDVGRDWSRSDRKTAKAGREGQALQVMCAARAARAAVARSSTVRAGSSGAG
jgi:hypothetical protein